MVRQIGISLLLFLSVGCAAQAGDEATGASDQAVIDATETFEHPEIGIVLHGNALCTGTLVRPNVVLTAAHCVTGRPKDEVQEGYSFVIKRSATERQTFAVDRVFSLPDASDFDGTDKWRRKDIALLRLVTDVPAGVATPLAIADEPAVPMSPVAIYGYGCTSRTPGADGRRPGTGTKRTKEYAWTPGVAFHWSGTVCPGDSGGPLLDVERGAVIGTTSGFTSSTDIFGDVPANHEAVLAIVATWAQSASGSSTTGQR